MPQGIHQILRILKNPDKKLSGFFCPIIGACNLVIVCSQDQILICDQFFHCLVLADYQKTNPMRF